jgi:hypothetical protein
MAELLLMTLGLLCTVGLTLGWGHQRKRSNTHMYGCSRCATEVRSHWEIKRCPACMKPYTSPP